MADTLSDSPAWQALRRHHVSIRDVHLRELFATDPGRVERLDGRGCRRPRGLLEAARHGRDDRAPRCRSPTSAGWRRDVDAMFRGEHINADRGPAGAPRRAARCRATRRSSSTARDVVPDVHAVLDRMRALRRRACARARGSATRGRPIRAVVNIGIGGSDLGPAMAYEALRALHRSRPRVPLRLERRRDRLRRGDARPRPGGDARSIVCVEDVHDAGDDDQRARRAGAWLVDGARGDEAAVARHFVAVSTNLDEVAAFGIDPANTFGFWDWVGGRYSMDSAIGLSTMVAIGPDALRRAARRLPRRRRALRGRRRSSGTCRVLMGLLAVWNRDFLGSRDPGGAPVRPVPRRASRRTCSSSSMESNGKSVTLGRARRSTSTRAPVLWGEPGTNGQHSFHQLLHQGTSIVPCDFIVFRASLNPLGEHHDAARRERARAGRGARVRATRPTRCARPASRRSLVPHRVFAGQPALDDAPASRPADPVRARRASSRSTSTASFTQGVIWGIDSFDQWGVELGKSSRAQLAPELAAPRTSIRRMPRSAPTGGARRTRSRAASRDGRA